jgi:hypothetical protein
MPRNACRLSVALVVMLALVPASAVGQSDTSRSVIFGVRISAGGRFDNVRKCVASPPGSRGGPAADISFFTHFGLSDSLSLVVNVPVL